MTADATDVWRSLARFSIGVWVLGFGRSWKWSPGTPAAHGVRSGLEAGIKGVDERAISWTLPTRSDRVHHVAEPNAGLRITEPQRACVARHFSLFTTPIPE